MGDYDEAIVSLAIALGFRKDIPVDRAYTIFQLFDCKKSGNIPILRKEVKETKMALGMALADDAATTEDIGNFLHDLAHIEQVEGSVEKAISFYEMALNVQRKAGGDDGEAALIWAKLAECWKEIGDQTKARVYAEAVSKFFKDTGDGKVKRQLGGWFGWDW
jgi:tetratricopeptide (TPR) repeat protein